MTVISLVSLPDVAFAGAERCSSISPAARVGGWVGFWGGGWQTWCPQDPASAILEPKMHLLAGRGWWHRAALPRPRSSAEATALAGAWMGLGWGPHPAPRRGGPQDPLIPEHRG